MLGSYAGRWEWWPSPSSLPADDLAAYLDAQAGYRVNRFTMHARDFEAVEHDWRQALDEWGYERPASSAERAAV